MVRPTNSATTRWAKGITSPTYTPRSYLLGLDNRRLEVPGHKRFDIDHGRVIGEILT